MKYEFVDKSDQISLIETEIRQAELSHFRSTVQNPDPEKDSAPYVEQHQLEDRIKKLKGALADLDDDKSKAARKAKKQGPPEAPAAAE